jgi:flagellar biosynthesis/type III secretory pathway chaperone
MGLAEFSNVLWGERQLLELLVFKLEEEQLVLASGRARWLNHATREVELVLDQIKAAELARAVEVAQLGSELGLGPNPSLRQLADSLDAPWRTIFDQHRRAFLSFTHDLQALAQANRELLSRGQRAAQEALSWLAPDAEPDVHSPTGISTARSASPRLVNEAF